MSPAELAQQALLVRFAPPAVLVDRQLRVLYFHGATARYLCQPAGEPTSHLLDLAREGLRAPLCAAMRQAIAGHIPVEAESCLGADGDGRRVRVSVAPTAAPQDGETCFLVSFAETAGNAEEGGPARLSTPDLEAAVQETRAELCDVMAELAAANEEFAAANAHLRRQVTEREARTKELEVLLDSSAVALLSLDAQGCIRAFTPALSSLLGVRSSDIGRPVHDLAPKFHDPDFEADRARVAETGLAVEREIQGQHGRWYLRRILPRRAAEGRDPGGPDGVVIIFLDITARRHAEEQLRAATDLAQRIIAATDQPLLALDADRRVRLANPALCRSFGLAAQEMVGRSVFEIGEGAWDIPELRRLIEAAQDSDARMCEVEIEHEASGPGQRNLALSVRPLDGTDMILLAVEDLTERTETERRQQVLVTELQHRVKNIFANVGALIDLTRHRSTSLDAFVSALEGRLRAMSRIQDLLTQRDYAPVYLHDLLHGELEAQGVATDTPEISIEGPDLHLDARTAQGLGMAVHELTTNAAKYGAFAAAGGHTAISWTVIRAEGGRHLLFRWRESAIAMPATPPEKGFGAELIEASIPYMLHGSARLDFRPDGVQCIIDVPLPGGTLPVDEPAEESLA